MNNVQRLCEKYLSSKRLTNLHHQLNLYLAKLWGVLFGNFYTTAITTEMPNLILE